jgi:hypothetical protein
VCERFHRSVSWTFLDRHANCNANGRPTAMPTAGQLQCQRQANCNANGMPTAMPTACQLQCQRHANSFLAHVLRCGVLSPYSPTALAAFSRNNEPSRMYRRSITVPL